MGWKRKKGPDFFYINLNCTFILSLIEKDISPVIIFVKIMGFKDAILGKFGTIKARYIKLRFTPSEKSFQTG